MSNLKRSVVNLFYLFRCLVQTLNFNQKTKAVCISHLKCSNDLLFIEFIVQSLFMYFFSIQY